MKNTLDTTQRRPGLESLATAAKWLEFNEGEEHGEADSCKAVSRWLFGLIAKSENETIARLVAKKTGRPLCDVRRLVKAIGGER